MDPDIRQWRKAERARLLAMRMAISLDTRIAAAESAGARIRKHVASGQTFGFYWPMRGEMDFRPLAEALYAQGTGLALPVVVAKNAPMVFRPWTPGCAMERGIWNIPQPATDATVHPDVVLAPVLGFTDDCYRLGYGGGYFDRTLAVLSPRPVAIAIGFACQRIATIHPQPHDIRLDAIVTESLEFFAG